MARICDNCGQPIKRNERWAEMKFRSGRKHTEHLPECPTSEQVAALEAKPVMQSRFPKRAGEDTVEL